MNFCVGFKFLFSLLLVFAMSMNPIVTKVVVADTDEVIAAAIADLQVFPNNGQDRDEMIVGNANGDRIYIVRFDTTVIEPFLTSDFDLVSAEVLLEEQDSRDGLNGNQTRTVAAYFFDTVECQFWNYNDVDNLNSFQDGVVPWFGNTQARPGRFGGQGSGGNTNVDIRADIDNPQLGTAFGDVDFATGQSDSLTIDLTNGSGLSTEVIKTILMEWVAGNNAGIGFADSTSSAFGIPAEDQIFFQSNNVAGGSSVDSTVNGVPAGSGVAQAGELGNGLGGPRLRLVFCPATGGCTFDIGDVNQDGSIDLLDVGPFVDLISTGDFLCEADTNEDGAVNLLDVGPFVELLSGG